MRQTNILSRQYWMLTNSLSLKKIKTAQIALICQGTYNILLGAKASKNFMASAPAPVPHNIRTWIRLQLWLLQNWLAPWLRAPAPAPAPLPWLHQYCIQTGNNCSVATADCILYTDRQQL